MRCFCEQKENFIFVYLSKEVRNEIFKGISFQQGLNVACDLDKN